MSATARVRVTDRDVERNGAWLALVVGVLAAGAIAALVRDLTMPEFGFALGWPWLAVAFYAAGASVVRVRIRGDVHSVSLSSLPLVVGFVITDPMSLVLAAVIGTVVAELVHIQRDPVRLLLTAARETLAVSLGLTMFHLMLSGGDPLGPQGLSAGIIGAFTATGVEIAIVVASMAVTTGRPRIKEFPELGILAIVGTGTNVSLGLIGLTLATLAPRAIVLLLVPAGTIYLAYRGYVAQKEHHERLEFLYDSSRILHESTQIDAAVVAMLEQSRRTFQADRAEITLFPANPSDPALRTVVTATGRPEVMQPLEEGASELGLAVVGGRAFRVEANAGPGLHEYLRVAGSVDAMVAPLRGETRVIGAFLLGNSRGAIDRFSDDDVRLFETLANNVSIALENGRLEKSLATVTELKEQLHHQAFHDQLTELANRTLFTEVVEAAVRAAPRPGSLAVLFLDLDDFKTINDSLGHDAGDELLIAVAERLRSCLRPNDVAARLGGDEFSVLLDRLETADTAVDVAQRILDSSRLPYDLGGKEVFVRASIGIALNSEEDHSHGDLLRNADVAMYEAKSGSKGSYAIYQPQMHDVIHARLAMKAELQRAVRREEFEVHYQPIIDLQTGLIASVEALVRWAHPERGLLTPDQFIGLAEETGVVRPIGTFVIRRACQDVMRWIVAHPDHMSLSVSINLSTRDLQDSRLVEDIARVIDETSIAPTSIILEVTESSVMSDPEPIVRRLRHLRQLGVRIAIDDFGTGYSSLDRLRDYPVDILKIPKTFVDHIALPGASSVLAKAIVDLGHTLGMSIIASGVEQAVQRDTLREWSCEFGQGYLFAHPGEAADIDALLSSDGTEDRSGRVINFPNTAG